MRVKDNEESGVVTHDGYAKRKKSLWVERGYRMQKKIEREERRAFHLPAGAGEKHVWPTTSIFFCSFFGSLDVRGLLSLLRIKERLLMYTGGPLTQLLLCRSHRSHTTTQ